jgi:hypothetical protein
MTEQDITPYLNWTKDMLRSEEGPVVSRIPGIREWIVCFSATAARVDRFLQLGHEGSRTLPQSLVLDLIELDQSALTDALDDEGLLKNFIFYWSAVADVYGSTGTSSQTEAKRLDLLVEWSLLLTALSGSSYPGVKLLAPRYRHERARLALTKLRKENTDFAHVALGLQLVQEHEAALGMRWDMQSASFTRTDETAGRGLKSARQPSDECGGKLVNRDPEFSVAASIVRAAEEPTLRFELYGNWRDHWRNTMR